MLIAYILWTLAKSFQNWIVDQSTARNFTLDIKFTWCYLKTRRVSKWGILYTVKSRVLMRLTNSEIKTCFAETSQYISIRNPLHRQSEKDCMCFKKRRVRTCNFMVEVLLFKEIHFGFACKQDILWCECCATEKSLRVFGALKWLNI